MTEDSRSLIAQLLEKQKYEEALPILDDLLEKNPADQECRTYHLLVVRILVLRWTLSRVETGQLSYSRPMANGVIGRLVSIARAGESTKLSRFLGRMYQRAERASANRHMKRVVLAGAGIGFIVTLLAFYRVERSDPTSQVPPATLTVTDVSPLTEPVWAYGPETTDEEARKAPLPAAADKQLLLQLTSAWKDLWATEHLGVLARQKPTARDAAQPTTRLDASAVAKPRQPRASTKNPQVKKNNGRLARKNLGYYQSDRAIPIRKWPRFAAPAVQNIDSGTSLKVLEFVGSWARVELAHARITGFVRKEFLASVQWPEPSVTR